jgi:transcriptional regulator with AAA-type ATPase domain
LTLLFDLESSFCKKIEDVVLLFNEAPNRADPIAEKVVMETIDAIRTKGPQIHCQTRKLITSDPTDHAQIFGFLKEELPKLRRQFVNREMVIHISPGTPAMQTVWVLMAECGFIQPPFCVVKSYRKSERKDKRAVVPVRIGIETFYKVFQSSQPGRTSTAEEKVQWDPARFKSEKLKALYKEARSFARLRVPILIMGERGTGKTTLANWIRVNSGYCRPGLHENWASVPCGQYTPETMRAELFGYVAGAYTGALKDHEGLLKIADGDTLFLDEVGDISRDLQRLLIRAVEDGTYNRLGSTKREKSVFRLITATNICESELKKRLDPDFYDRIGGLRLTIPPLRQILEDLPSLWRSSFENAVSRCGVGGSIELTQAQHDEVVARLSAHRLEGNIRDLLRVANRVIARIADGSSESWEFVLDYAVSDLAGADLTTTEASTVSTSLARAFADGDRIDTLVERLGSIGTRQLDSDLKAFLASELRRIAAERKIDPSDICDVSSRTLRDWNGRK